MIHLRSISISGTANETGFPFSVPSLRALSELTFDSEITFFVGENGSGKSTLLEALATAAGSITVGSESVTTDQTLTEVRRFSRCLKLVWNQRTKKGFFMRSEDFFGYVKHMNAVKAEMLADLQEIEETYKGRSKTAKGLASMPYARELNDMQQRYGAGLDAAIHTVKASSRCSGRALCRTASTCSTNRKRRSRRAASSRCWRCSSRWSIRAHSS